MIGPGNLQAQAFAWPTAAMKSELVGPATLYVMQQAGPACVYLRVLRLSDRLSSLPGVCRGRPGLLSGCAC